MADFKKGDIVRLNSGGPAMTVESVGTSIIDCRYFDSESRTYYLASLTKDLLVDSTPDNYPIDFVRAFKSK